MENVLINIDTRFRNKEVFVNPGCFVYNLKEPMKNVTYVRLSSIELPNMYYSFNSKYNNTSFKIIFNENICDVIINEGNYTSDLIINKIQYILNNINTLYETNFNISWDNINYKVSIYNTMPFSLEFDNETNIFHSLGYYLGFRYNNDKYLMENQETIMIDNLSSYYWTGNTFLDITKDEYLFLRLNDYGTIHNDVREHTLFAKIIMFDSQYIVDNGANLLTKMYKFKQPVNLTKFEIELISPIGYTIDMNDIDYSLTLEVGQIYDANLLESINDNYIFKKNNNKFNY